MVLMTHGIPSPNEGICWSLNGSSYNTVDYEIKNSQNDVIGSTATVQQNTFEDALHKSVNTKNTGLIYPLQPAYIVTGQPDIDGVYDGIAKYGLTHGDNNQAFKFPADTDNTFVLGYETTIPRLNVRDYYSVSSHISNGQGSALQLQNGGKDSSVAGIGTTTTEYTKIGKYMNNINLGLIERSPIDLAIKNDIVQTNTTLNEVVSDANINGFGMKPASTNSSFDIGGDSSESDQDKYKSKRDNAYFNTQYTQPLGKDEYNWRSGPDGFVENSKTLTNDDLQLYVQYKITVRNQSDLNSGCVTEIADYYDSDMYYPVGTNQAWRYYDPNTDYTAGTYAKNSNDWQGYADIVIPKIFPGDGNGNLMTSWAVKNEGTNNSKDLGAVVWNSNSKFTNSDTNNNKLMPDGLQAMYTKSLENEILTKGETISIYVIFKVKQTSDWHVITDDNSAGKVNIAEINSYKSFNYDPDAPNHINSNPAIAVGGRLDIDSAPGNADVSQIKKNVDNQTKYVTFEDDTDAAPLLKVTVDNGINRGIYGYAWEDAVENTDKGALNQKIGDGQINWEGDITGPAKDVIQSLEPFINNVSVQLVRKEYDKASGNYFETPFTDKYKKDNIVVTYTGLGEGDSGDSYIRDREHGRYSFNNLVPSGKYEVRFNYGKEDQIEKQLEAMNKDTNKSMYDTRDAIYNGHDYKSTVLCGEMRPDVNNQLPPDTEIVIVVNSSQMSTPARQGSKINDAITGVVSNLVSDLTGKDAQLTSHITVLDCNTIYKDSRRVTGDIKQLGKGNPDSETDATHTAQAATVNGIFSANNILSSSNATNKVMVLIQDGFSNGNSTYSSPGDPSVVSSGGSNSILTTLNSGVNVIGIGIGNESLKVFKTEGGNGQLPSTYTLNETNKDLIEQNIYDKIIASIIKTNFLKPYYNHAEDYLQDTVLYTFDEMINRVKTDKNASDSEYYNRNSSQFKDASLSSLSVNGRLEVMQFSQDMTAKVQKNDKLGITSNPGVSDVLNMEYIENMPVDTAPWTQAVKNFTDNTDMTAHSYTFSVDFKDKDDSVYQINLGLQEIPQTKLEVKDRVNNITVTLSNGQKIVDLTVDDNGVVTPTSPGLSQNVQPIPRSTSTNGLFSIYMDQEIMQGARIDVTYRISVSNVGDVDNLWPYLRYETDMKTISDWYLALTGENIPTNKELDEWLREAVPVNIEKLYSYYDNLTFRAEDNSKMKVEGLQVIPEENPSEGTNRAGVSRYADTGELMLGNSANIVTDTIAPTAKWDIAIDPRDNLSELKFPESTSANTSQYFVLSDSTSSTSKKYSIVETTTLGNVSLYPNKSDEVLNKGQASTLRTYLKLSKTLSSQDTDMQDILKYNNFTEIVEAYSITGRRDYDGKEGNFAGASYFNKSTIGLQNLSDRTPGKLYERDTDAAEKIIILPPFGDGKKIPYAILAGCIVILAGGVVFIKRKIL